MKGILKRWIALSLSFMLMCAAIPVRAQENEMDVQAETQTMESEIEQRINFVYIESPYLETSKTQKMVVSWGDGTEEIESITANLTGESGTEEWEATQHSGNLYLFEKEFSEDQNGTYEVTELNVKTADATQTFALADLGIAAEFGVNETYDGIEELKPLDAQETQELETSVVMIDQNGETEVHDGISEALREVSREMEGPSAKMRAASVDSRDSEIVVALDPGHDSSHSGASANGLREEVLTLKIANYCKTELEQYEGVRVYMTRTGAACPYPESTSSGDDIDRRAKAAAKQGARIFVSFHLNSSTASSAKGAEVIYPNSSWKPQVGADGKALATAIWDELGKLGLEKRPIYSKNTTLDEKYPDGSISDYFSVQISCKEENIPGIIVEHAFISNSSDAENFLKTEAGLKKLGVADATGIAKFLGLKKESSNKNGWITEGGQKYYYVNGEKASGWQTIGGKRYYFIAPDHHMHTGWLSFGSTYYYMMSDGHMHTGWLSFGSTYYYLNSNGVRVTGWQTIGGKKYYFAKDGKRQTGWQTIDGKRYYFIAPDYHMHTGWLSFGSTYYYMMSDGHMHTGWLSFGSTYYYLNSNGVRVTGWQIIGGKKYYFAKDGKRQTGWQTIDGKRYYFIAPDYHMHTGWLSFGSTYYYLNSNGVSVTGWQTIDGKEYYFDENGIRRDAVKKEGWQTENGKRYYYRNGVKVTGWQTIGGKRYYFIAPDYHMHTGWLSFGSTYYYMMSDGHMHTGWLSFGSTYYYLNSNGVRVTGWQTIGGVRYYFDSNGVRAEYYNIEGKTQTTVSQMVKFYQKSGKRYPSSALGKGGASTIQSFCQLYYEEAAKEGIRAEVAFAQAMEETGWLQYGGDVKIEQFNFAGLGATGGGVRGESFKDVRTGIRAQIQHLKAYASTKPLNGVCVDNRFKYVKRGCAPYVEILGIPDNPDGLGWAAKKGYGFDIRGMIDVMLGL